MFAHNPAAHKQVVVDVHTKLLVQIPCTGWVDHGVNMRRIVCVVDNPECGVAGIEVFIDRHLLKCQCATGGRLEQLRIGPWVAAGADSMEVRVGIDQVG